MGLGDILNNAKDKIKGQVPSDAKIDEIAETVKDKTPDQIDGVVDKVAEQAKKLNDD